MESFVNFCEDTIFEVTLPQLGFIYCEHTFFLFFIGNIDCRYLEASNECPLDMFLWEKKNNGDVGALLYQSLKVNCYEVTVKSVLSGHSKIDKTNILMSKGSLMKVERIAECSPWSILLYF